MSSWSGEPAGSTSPHCRTGSRRVRDLATATPAAFIAFDLLAHDGRDQRDRPYRKRRRKLEKLLSRSLPDGLVLTPAATDAAVARTWMLRHGTSGIEGVVAKRLDQPYRPGRRAWQKLRTRVTAEAVAAGVIGPVDAPRELILGRFDEDGRLRIAGRTTRLSPTAGAQLVGLLCPAIAHPWPELLPPHPYGGGRTSYTRVIPEVVVELSVDLAMDGLRWRHPVRFVRIRAELHPLDLLAQSNDPCSEDDEAL